MSGPALGEGRRRWRLRTWSPDYDRGSRPEADHLGTPEVDVAVERAVGAWRPFGSPLTLGPGGVAGSTPEALPPIAFVDGVQRVDAWADVETDVEADPGAPPAVADGALGEALFASYLAGAVS